MSSSSTLAATVKDLKESLAKELPIQDSDDVKVERCRDLLQRLEETPMTLQILSETLVGTVVSKFKSHSVLGPQAKGIIKMWKKLAKQEAGAASNNGSTATTTTTTTTAAVAVAATAKTKKKNKPTPPERQSSTASLTSTIPSPADEWADLPPLRKNICTKLHSILELSKPSLLREGFHANAVAQLLLSRASEVEEAIQRKTTKETNDRSQYTSKARSLVFNLRKNNVLRDRVLLGHTSAEELTDMSSEQLATAESAKERQAATQKLNESRRLDWEQKNEDKINKMCGIEGELLKASLFTCGRCKSTKTTSTQKQTRSADEPMTVFVLCMNCGKRWKC